MRKHLGGGRGNKAPYKTTTVRIPEPLLKDVRVMIEGYLERLENVSKTDNSDYDAVNNLCSVATPPLNECLEIARKIKRQKKSASASLVKLLQVLYKDDSISQEDIK